MTTRKAPDPIRAARLRKARQELRAQEAQKLLESVSITLDPTPRPTLARAILNLLHKK